jgi:hypothetical protein
MCKSFVEEENENKGKRLLSRTLFDKALKSTNYTVTNSVLAPIEEFARENDPAAYRQIKMITRVLDVPKSVRREKVAVNLTPDSGSPSK